MNSVLVTWTRWPERSAPGHRDALPRSRCRDGRWPRQSGSAAGRSSPSTRALLCGGVLLVARLVGGYTPRTRRARSPSPPPGGHGAPHPGPRRGTRLSTLCERASPSSGLYGLAFVGGWMEQIRTIAGNPTARYIGSGRASLVPSESLWQLASHHMQPPSLRDMAIGPFAPLSVPEPGHGGVGVGYVLVTSPLPCASSARGIFDVIGRFYRGLTQLESRSCDPAHPHLTNHPIASLRSITAAGCVRLSLLRGNPRRAHCLGVDSADP